MVVEGCFGGIKLEFALFICVPLVELYLLFRIGAKIGPAPTIGLVVITGFIGASLAHLAPSVPPPEARRTSALLAHTVAEDAVAPRRASQIPAVVGASLEHLAPPTPPPGRRTSAILAERLL